MVRTPIALAALLLIGCGDEFDDRCAEVCPEEPIACAAGQVDCQKSCAEQARSAAEFACDAEAGGYWACAAANDLCAEGVPDDCADEFSLFYDCLANFCDHNPNEPSCGASGQGGASS